METNSNVKPNQRLMITKMILENFKSYAGAQEIGPFHKRFSSIVGPNGSGKSNVIDALLFVFGKRANQLRLNKVSELIHKSANFPNLEYAKVEVFFQLIIDDETHDDNYEVVPDSAFVVTRIAYQNNQSKYTVDSRSSTYTNVGLLLRSYGIDLDNNRFLILQGEVEQIAMMKPKALTPHEEGLLEYLEDIIGSNRFVALIDEVSKSLDEITEQRVEKVNRLKIAEKERDNLSGSKLEAEAFLEKEKEIRAKKNILYQVLENQANTQIEKLQSNMNKTNDKLLIEKDKLKEKEIRLSTIQVDYDKIKAEHDKVNHQLQSSSMQYDAFERNDVKLQEDMKHTKGLIKKQQVIIAKEIKKETECLQEASEVEIQIGKYEQLINDFHTKKAEEELQLEKIMEGLQESTQGLRSTLEGVQIQLMEQEKSVASLQTDKESVQTSLNLLHTRSQNAIKSKSLLEEKLNKLITDRNMMANRVNSLENTEHSVLVDKIKLTEEEVNSCIQKEQLLQQSIREAVTEAEVGKANLASQQNQSGNNQIIQKVLQASRKGGVLNAAGVHGRLGDLGTISSEYDVAISTACGILDYIVVDNSAGGQACINYLREMNLGRASFIVLDQMSEWNNKMNRKLNLPPGTQRLFDLINPIHEMFRPAFYMALKDTLVVADLKQAVRVAYDGDRTVWRVVTQDGNLIDISGSMSGGGKETRSGAMKLSSSSSTTTNVSNNNNKGMNKNSSLTNQLLNDENITPAQVLELENKVIDLQQKLNQCRMQKTNAENQLKDLKKKLKDLLTEVEKSQMAINRFVEQEQELLSRIEEISIECVLSNDEKNQIKTQEAKLIDIENEISKVSPNLRSMQNEVASLQRQILGVGGPKLSKIQAKIDSFAAQIESFSSNLSIKTVDANNARKQADKAIQIRTKAELDMNKSEIKLSELIAQQKEMETDALEVINAVEAAKEQMVGLESELQVITKEYNELKATVSKVKTMELDLTVEIERINVDLKESKATAKKWHQESESIRQQHLQEQREFNTVVRSVTQVNAQLSSNPSTVPSVTAVITEQMTDGSPMKIDKSSEECNSFDHELEQLLVYEALELQNYDIEELKREINIMETMKNKMKNSVNMSALLEYMRKDASYKNRLLDVEQITEARNVIRRKYEDLRRQRLEEFMVGFGIISLKLKEMYQMITLGGDAELELLDSLDPFTEGIVFSVRPPKKSWKNISNLSGGEKTLSSLALVFALHHYKPTPLYVMDEIDAALDFKNVSIVANYIKERTKNAQFIIISLRNNMFELADRLVGIYKTNDATKSVTINPKMFENATLGITPSSISIGNTNKSTTSNVKVTPSVIHSPLGDVTNQIKA